jgi:hypothetical protein
MRPSREPALGRGGGARKRDTQKGITKKGLPKRNWNHRKGSLKRDCQKEIGITAKRDHQKGIAKKKLGSPQKLILTCYQQSAGKQTNKRVRWQTNKRVRWQDVSHKEYGSSRVDKRFIPAS